MHERIAICTLDAPLFPSTDLGVQITDAGECELVADALIGSRCLGVVMEDTRGRRHVGTYAAITGYARLVDGRYLVELEGLNRFNVKAFHDDSRYTITEAEALTDGIGNFGLARTAGDEAERLFTTYRTSLGDEFSTRLPADPVAKSYVMASRIDLEPQMKQDLLEQPTAADRLAAIVALLADTWADAVPHGSQR